MRMIVRSATSNKTTTLYITHWTDSLPLSQVLAIYFAGESMFIGGR